MQLAEGNFPALNIAAADEIYVFSIAYKNSKVASALWVFLRI